MAPRAACGRSGGHDALDPSFGCTWGRAGRRRPPRGAAARATGARRALVAATHCMVAAMGRDRRDQAPNGFACRSCWGVQHAIRNFAAKWLRASCPAVAVRQWWVGSKHHGRPNQSRACRAGSGGGGNVGSPTSRPARFSPLLHPHHCIVSCKPLADDRSPMCRCCSATQPARRACTPQRCSALPRPPLPPPSRAAGCYRITKEELNARG